MPDAPLSRRARRIVEAEAAERAASQGDPTAAYGVVTGEVPTVNPETQSLTRRDRRRLERLSRPMEAWTAEEEMIATGQIPAMTPERIAEHERLARETAARAAEDAQTASAALRTLAPTEIRQPEPDPQAEVVGESVAQVEPPAPAGSIAGPLVEPELRHDSTAPVEERVIVEPYSPRFDLDEAELGAVAQESAPIAGSDDVGPHAGIVRTPSPVADEEPEGTLAAGERAAQEAAARAKVFEELFPPGSSQAALLEQDRLAQLEKVESAKAEQASAATVIEEPESVEGQQAAVDEGRAAVDEIRKLAEEAMSGIERAAHHRDEVAAAAPAPGRFDLPVADEDEPDQARFATVGEALAPHQAAFDEAVQGALGETPLRPMGPRPMTPAAGAMKLSPGPMPQQQQPFPQSALPQLAQPLDAAPAWGNPALAAAQGAVADPDDFQPLTNAPRPDFSTLYTQPQGSSFSPSTGPIPIDVSTTGQIAPVRRLPDAVEVGGAKHFKWPHLALIGALMFALGTIIYEVAWGR